MFACPRLLHANLSYNQLPALALPPPLPQQLLAPLVSLDLSHNNLTDLVATLDSLSRLPALGVLSLAGNPLCMIPVYASAVRSTLKQLVYLDNKVSAGQTATP